MEHSSSLTPGNDLLQVFRGACILILQQDKDVNFPKNFIKQNPNHNSQTQQKHLHKIQSLPTPFLAELLQRNHNLRFTL